MIECVSIQLLIIKDINIEEVSQKRTLYNQNMSLECYLYNVMASIIGGLRNTRAGEQKAPNAMI
jgi:hypothetical protein